MSNLLGMGENDDLISRNEEEKLMNVTNDGDLLRETYFEKRQEVENIELIEKEISNINDLLILEDQHDSVTSQIVNEEQKSAENVNKMWVFRDGDGFFQSLKRRTDGCTNSLLTSCKKRKSEINTKKENDNKSIDLNYFANDVQTSKEIENNSLLGNEINKHTDISNPEKDVNIINSGGFSNGEENMLLENDMKNITNQEDDDENMIKQSAIQNETEDTKVDNKKSSIGKETNNKTTTDEDAEGKTIGQYAMQNKTDDTKVEENNSSLEIEIPIIPSLAIEVYKTGLSQDEHVEERLEIMQGHEENEIRNKVLRYLPGLTINSVKRVQNNFLRGLYYLKKEEYESRDIVVKEQSLFHSTAEANVNSIIQDNFDWRRVWRYRYGRGISFASDADYANCHANRRNANVGAKRAFIIAKVLVGKSNEGSGCLKIPPEGYDTTTGANGIVIVKYNNNEFLPEYVVFYDCNNISKSKYY